MGVRWWRVSWGEGVRGSAACLTITSARRNQSARPRLGTIRVGEGMEDAFCLRGYPSQGEKAKLGPRLAQALATVQAILSGLRDAKP